MKHVNLRALVGMMSYLDVCGVHIYPVGFGEMNLHNVHVA